MSIFRVGISNDHEVTRLLKLDHEASRANRMRQPARDEDEIAWLHGDAMKTGENRIPALVSLRRTIPRVKRPFPVHARHTLLKAQINTRIRCRSRQEVPAFCLADGAPQTHTRKRHGGMRLNDQTLVGIQQSSSFTSIGNSPTTSFTRRPSTKRPSPSPAIPNEPLNAETVDAVQSSGRVIPSS